MALVPIRIDRTSKPPIGTPLRSDGHWSVQGLVGAWAFNEGAGRTVFNAVTGEPLTILIGSTWRPAGLYRNGGAYTGEVAAYGGIAPITGEHGVTLTWLGVSGAAGARGVFNLGSASTVATCGLLGSDTGEGLRFLCRDLNVNTYNGENAAVDIVDGKPHVMSVTGRLGITNMSVSVDGQSLFNVEKPATYTPYGFNVVVFGGMHRGSPEIAASATHILGLIHAVEHSPSQIASLSSNPWQIYEPETVWIEVGGGGEAALFSGSVYGQSSTSAQLSTAIRMAASAQGYGASTADLSTTIALAADILAASSASGALSTAIRFGGALSGSSTTTAALTNAITLAAQAAGLGSIGGQLAGTVAAALFAGTISGSSSASANLSTAVVLAAAAQGSSTAQAVLSTALEMAAQVNGIGSVAGTLGADISGLAGSLHGSSEAQATLSTAIHLMGVAAGQCGVVGRLAEPIEILAQLRVMAYDPLALRISVRDPLALRVTVQ